MTVPAQESAMIAAAERSWIARTGQRWKFAIFVILIVAAFAVLIGVVECDTLFAACSGRRVLSLLTLFVVLAAAAFGWLLASLRCPQCGRSVSVWVLKN